MVLSFLWPRKKNTQETAEKPPERERSSIDSKESLPENDIQEIKDSIKNLEELLADKTLPRSKRITISNAIERLSTKVDYLTGKPINAYFIGRVGVGKSTTISEISNLIRDEKEFRAICAQTWDAKEKSLQASLSAAKIKYQDNPTLKADIDKRTKRLEAHRKTQRIPPYNSSSPQAIILPAATGRTTLCQTSIEYGPAPSIHITPLPEHKLTNILEMVVALAFDESHSLKKSSGEQSSAIPREIERAIANMCGYKPTAKLTEFLRAEGTKAQALARLHKAANTARRTQTQLFWKPSNGLASTWMANALLNIHTVTDPDLPYPEQIKIYWPNSPKGIRFIDLRGIDGAIKTPTDEISKCLTDRTALHIFCAPIESSPGAEAEAILRYRTEIYGITDPIILFGINKGATLSGNTHQDDEEAEESEHDNIHALTDLEYLKAQESARILRRALSVPQSYIAFGNPAVAPRIFTDTIRDAIDNLKKTMKEQIRPDLEECRLMLDQGWADDIIREQIHAQINDFCHQPHIKHPQPIEPLHSGIPEDISPMTIWAMLRRYGSYDNLNLPRILADFYVRRISPTLSQMADATNIILIRTVEDARKTGTSPRLLDATEALIRKDVEARLLAIRIKIQGGLTTSIATYILDTQSTIDTFDTCLSYFGNPHIIPNKGKFRQTVITSMDELAINDIQSHSESAFEKLWSDFITEDAEHTSEATTADDKTWHFATKSQYAPDPGWDDLTPIEHDPFS